MANHEEKHALNDAHDASYSILDVPRDFMLQKKINRIEDPMVATFLSNDRTNIVFEDI